MVKRFEIYWTDLDPTLGSEISKVRPCVIVSPNELNKALKTVIIAPLTSTFKDYPSRLGIKFKGKHGQIALDQIRTIDKARLVGKGGTVDTSNAKKISGLLVEIFTY